MKEELVLIEKVRKKNSRALKELYQRYLPMVNLVKSRFFIRDYDQDDWQQEAMLVCYETAILWREGMKSFGSFYKLRLLNHARTLVRYQAAKRRAAFSHATSYEVVVENGMQVDPLTSFAKVPASETMGNLIQGLSLLELFALLETLGIISHEEALERLKISEQSLIRAKSRVVRKLKDILF